VTGRILREPAFEHTLLLLENFVDAPETGEGHGTGKGGANKRMDKQRSNRTNHSKNQEKPPDLSSPSVFEADYQRVKEADAGKNGCTYNNPIPVHNFALIFREAKIETQPLFF
jgi:hypothetical protein